ncbi:flagellar motor protein MotD [Stutzerimonas tarimensis]|uniref:Flagellar motor protein MotD n=1 Tax=Stutzerimonas tarimensis TaxID=1507735 RepID=A0ABV7T9M2_9GAMM
MARRRRREEPENHERWLVSYADFITLLFAFFVVMYSISSVNEGKYKVFTESLEGIFTQPERSIRPIPLGEHPTMDVSDALAVSEHDPLASIARSIHAAFGGLIEGDEIKVRGTEMWLEIELNSSLLFPSGGAIPNDSAFALLERVATILAPYRNPVQVQGFTDNLPISTASYPTNWELSAARAASVVRMLATYGVDPAQLAAVGYGEYSPVADNSTAAGRARNRRVVLAVARDVEIQRSSGQFERLPPNAVGTPSASALATEASEVDTVNSLSLP